MDDEGLVKRAMAGDDAAFELLVRRHTDAVWRFARTLTEDDFAAEEAVQDTFLKAYRALDGYRGEAAVRTWLLSICHRTCLDRRRRRRLNVVSLDHARHHATSRGAIDDADMRLALEQVLPSVPEDERHAFVLVDVLSYRAEEAAQVVGVPSSTLRSRLGRARRRLVESLYGGDEVEHLA